MIEWFVDIMILLLLVGSGVDGERGRGERVVNRHGAGMERNLSATEVG